MTKRNSTHMNHAVLPLPIELVCLVLAYVTQPEAHLLLTYVLSPTKAEAQYVVRVLGITQQHAAEGFAQIGETQQLQQILQDSIDAQHANVVSSCRAKPSTFEAAYAYPAAIDISRILCAAARSDQLVAMELARKHGADHYGQAFGAAAREGRTAAMKLLLSWSRNCSDSSEKVSRAVRLRRRIFLFDQCLWDAARMGHIETMLLLKECGATDWAFAMRLAAEHGQLQAMTELHSWLCEAAATALAASAPASASASAEGTDENTASDSASAVGKDESKDPETAAAKSREKDFIIDLALCAAAGGGHAEATILAKQLGASQQCHDEALSWAASNGHVAIMHLLRDAHEFGLVSPVEAYNEALRAACESGSSSLEAIQLLRNWGANDVDSALAAAASKGHVKVMQLLREWCTCTNCNNCNLGDALVNAAQTGQVEAARFLLEWATEVESNGNGNSVLSAEQMSAALCEAARHSGSEYLHLIKLFILIERRDIVRGSMLENALVTAAGAGNEHGIRLLAKAGARNFNDALERARIELHRLYTIELPTRQSRVSSMRAVIALLKQSVVVE